MQYPDSSSVTFAYDANGNRTSMVDNLGTSGYSYDVLNRMTSYANPFGKTILYGYDANGNRTSLTYPDGKKVSYTYDAMNRLATVTDWLTTEAIYTYDAVGNLVQTLNPNNTKATYTYDVAERLTEFLNTKSNSSVISSYSYTLDAIGNHASVTKDEPLAPILASQNIAYTYDAENRLTAAGDRSYTYDANGNLTGKGSYTFSYDYENRLSQSNIGGTATQYDYDGLGNRLGKTVGGANTRYVLDINGTLSNVLAETDGTAAITVYYIYGLGLISKVLPDDTACYYHYDSRGSTVALTDPSQETTDAYAYDSFGSSANSTGTIQNPFKYVGRYGVMEEGNGLNYIRARYYSPEIGRFITKDPKTGNDRDGQSLNRYVYALNNPVILIDISGFSAREGEVNRSPEGSSDTVHNYYVERKHELMKRMIQVIEVQTLREQEIWLEAEINMLEGALECGGALFKLMIGDVKGALGNIIDMTSIAFKAGGMEKTAAWIKAGGIAYNLGAFIYGVPQKLEAIKVTAKTVRTLRIWPTIMKIDVAYSSGQYFGQSIGAVKTALDFGVGIGKGIFDIF